MESLISKSMGELEERNKRLKRVDDLIAELAWTVENLRNVLYATVDEFYKYTVPYNPKITKEDVLEDPAIKYLIEPGHTLPEGMGKHSGLFKNIAILFVQAGFNDEEMREMSRKIVANCPNHLPQEIMGWVKHILTHNERKWECNLHEVNKVLEKANI